MKQRELKQKLTKIPFYMIPQL